MKLEYFVVRPDVGIVDAVVSFDVETASGSSTSSETISLDQNEIDTDTCDLDAIMSALKLKINGLRVVNKQKPIELPAPVKVILEEVPAKVIKEP